MEFIISQGETKRKLEGDFWLCASKANVKHLIQELKRWLPTATYGWRRICGPVTDSPAPGLPEPWETTKEEG